MQIFQSFRSQSAAHSLTVAIVAASIFNGLWFQLFARSSLTDILLFVPWKTAYSLQVWRPFTALLIAHTPTMVILGALIVYSIGGMLESRWGPRRFLRVVLGLPLLANVLSLPLTLSLVPGVPFACAGSVITTVWILYGLRAEFSGEWISFWGTPVRGKTFALIGVGFPVLSGILGDIRGVLPELASAGVAYAFMYKPGLFTPLSRLEGVVERLQRLGRRGKRKSSLKVVQGKRFSGDDDYSGHQIH